ncbi:LAMI_0F05952g1_1 [Lachancea mirantina]|uniref:LAMI_0F05952g1_1 n=1 Tax=Lachancea mirantina TaxID=1230905 RepID=A0A1G4JYM8_9SACH|nr:LAMI_0F05952g1_1 [Lachancea mirantina]
MPDKQASSHDKGNLAGSIAGAVAGSDIAGKLGMGQIGGIASSILGSAEGGKAENKIKDKIDNH